MQKNKAVILITILLLVVSLREPIFALEKMSLQDRAICSTFKTLARGFVAAMDLNKFKKVNINRINEIPLDKFKIKYDVIYETLKDLPPEFKIKYGITKNMPKEQLIKDIELMDKKSIYESINEVPDAFIVKEFKKYLDQKKQNTRKVDLIKEINVFWNKILAKVKEPMLQK